MSQRWATAYRSARKIPRGLTARRVDLAAVITTIALALRRNTLSDAQLNRLDRKRRADVILACGWNRQANILGFGIGPKSVSRKEASPDDALIVFVASKIARTRLHPEERVPARVRFESIGRWVTTDVQPLGEIPRLQANPSLMPGSDAAHFTMAHGTITAIVKPRVPPLMPMLLSCAHGFAPLGAAGVTIESPPDVSSLTAANPVGNLTLALPLIPGGNIANVVDAALAVPLAGKVAAVSNTLPGLGQLSTVSSLVSGTFRSNGVVNVGATGAMTPRLSGQIIGENISTVLADPRGRVFLYQNVVAYRPNLMPQAGDSGMPIIRAVAPGQFELLGMHIGFGGILGAPNVRAAFFVPASTFMSKLTVDLL